MEFATSKDQYSGEKRELIVLNDCDGSCIEHTVEHQLIEAGVLNRKYSHAGEDTPGSIFYWNKHVAAPQFSPDYVADKVPGHCAWCYKEIEYQYHYILTGNRIVNLNEKYDVCLPESIVTGSECIKLGREMGNLLTNLRKYTMYGSRLRFTRGRILARDIVNAAPGWDKDIDRIALPLRWFYFEDWWRPVLMLGQENMGYGYHTRYQGSEYSVWGNMKRAAAGNRNVSAFHLFSGMDEFHEETDIYTHGRQTAEDDKYVVLTRQSATNLSYEIRNRRRKLKMTGSFKDDK